MNVSQHRLEERLGWRPEPDHIRAVEMPKRLRRFAMAADIPPVALKNEISYRTPILDQIGPSCVGYSIRTKLDGAPMRTRRGPSGLDIYRIANSRDEWAPTPHDGTSTRAGMDVILEHGLIERYTWAQTIDDAIRFIRSGKGGVIFGTWWYEGMFYPDPKTGLIVPTGRRRGGHAYFVRRFSNRLGVCGIAQTWGRSWSKNGYALIQVEHLERLLNEDGEAAAAIEVAR